MIRRIIICSAALLLSCLSGIGSSHAAYPTAQAGSPITLEVRAGFDGYIEQHTYAPITIVASNAGEDVSGDLSVTVGGITGGETQYTQPVELPRGSRKQIRLYPANFNTFGKQITVDFRQAGHAVATQQTPVTFIDQGTLLIGMLSDSPGALASLGKVSTANGPAAVARLTLDDLPPLAEAWTALDVLVIADTDTGQLSPEQQAAMAQWVEHGGRLIIASGPNYQRTLAGLGALSPVLADSTQSAPLTALGQATGEPFPPNAPEALVATGRLTADAHKLLSAGATPLLVWRLAGYGRVDFLAADPGLEPLRSWANMESLWTLILEDGEARPAWAYGLNASTAPAEQAVAAVPGVTLPSVLELCAFLMAYVILIGPVNYFVLWRLKRRELAWVTVPLLVVVFSGIAYFTGFQLRGSQAILHRLAVIETWPGSDAGEVHMLFGVWSPGRTAYDIQIEPGFLARPLPRDLSGALAAASGAHIEDGQNVTLRGVQVDIGSIQPFVIEGFMAAPPRIDGQISVTPVSDGLRLRGAIVNYSNLSLTSVNLVTPIGSVNVDNLPAGGVLKVDSTLSAAQASQNAGSGLEPFPANAGGYYGPYGSSSLSSDLTAGQDCYDANTDRRKCSLASSILNGDARGSTVYLAGWTDTVPIRTQVLNASSQQKDVALIIAQMTTNVTPDATAPKAIPPGLMTWKITDPSGGATGSTPYGLYLSGSAQPVIRFEPLRFVPLPAIDSVVVHLDSYDQTTLPRVELWNNLQARWEPVQVQWGDTTLPGQAFVDDLGGVLIRVSLGDSNANGLNLTRLDVTLMGH